MKKEQMTLRESILTAGETQLLRKLSKSGSHCIVRCGEEIILLPAEAAQWEAPRVLSLLVFRGAYERLWAYEDGGWTVDDL